MFSPIYAHRQLGHIAKGAVPVGGGAGYSGGSCSIKTPYPVFV